MIMIHGIMSNGKFCFYDWKTGTQDLKHHDIKRKFISFWLLRHKWSRMKVQIQETKTFA